MEEIFISYKSERRRAAEHLAEVLRRHGYSVWFDYHLIKGEDFDFQLDAKLVAAKAVVVLWCTQSVESKWVSREAARAMQRGTLVPTMIETCELKTAHVNADCIDLRAWDGGPRSHVLDPLFDALEGRIGRAPVPDFKTLRAYEETWRRFGAPSLKAFALDGPRETAEARVAETIGEGAAVPDRSTGRASDSRVAEAALVWPDVRDSADVRRLRRFEEMFAGTFYAAEAAELRLAVEAQARRKQLTEEQARREVIEAEVRQRQHAEEQAERVRRKQPLLTLTGHAYAVEAVAVTLDGRLAVSGSSDKTLKVWDLATGKELRTLTGHSDAVYGVAVTSDGRLAVSGSVDKTLKVWDLATGKELCTLTGHSELVLAVAVTSDGRLVVSGGWDRTLKVWDLGTGRELRTLTVGVGEVKTVAVTLDGRFVVSNGWDRTLKVWDLGTGRQVRTLTGHSEVVLAVAVTSDGRFAVSGSVDKTLKVWDLTSGLELRTLTGHSGLVRAVAATPDGRLAVSGSWDKTLKVWDISDL